MTILVTGSTGYFGHQLALSLADSGNKVHVLVRDVASPFVPVHDNIRVFPGDVSNAEQVKLALKGCQQVYHPAAEVKVRSKTMFSSNVDGTKQLLDCALQEGVSKLVYTSTCATLGNYFNEPVNENNVRTTPFENDYELSKSIAEKIVKAYSQKGISTITVFISKLFGPGFDRRTPGMLSMIKRAMDGSLVFVPGYKPVLSNFVFMEDAIRGHILAMEKGVSGETYIIGGKNLTSNEFFLLAGALNGKHPILIRTPLFVTKLIARIVDGISTLAGKEPLISANAAKELYKQKAFSSDKAITQLGYNITPIEEALSKTLHFLNSNPHAQPNNLVIA